MSHALFYTKKGTPLWTQIFEVYHTVLLKVVYLYFNKSVAMYFIKSDTSTVDYFLLSMTKRLVKLQKFAFSSRNNLVCSVLQRF